MIIEYVKGDAIKMFLASDTKHMAFAHGCNLYCTMGSGIAKQVKAELTALYDIDQKTTRADIHKLGSVTYAPFVIERMIEGKYETIVKYGFNMYTQNTYWDPERMLSYEAIESAFITFNDICRINGLKTAVIPKIGAGLARGDWNKIEEIINRVTPDVQITVAVFE